MESSSVGTAKCDELGHIRTIFYTRKNKSRHLIQDVSNLGRQHAFCTVHTVISVLSPQVVYFFQTSLRGRLINAKGGGGGTHSKFYASSRLCVRFSILRAMNDD